MKSLNPFVPITRVERLVIGGLFTLLIFFVGIVNLPQSRYDLVLIYMAFASFLFVLWLPFLVLRPSWLGWYHPLVFAALWWGIVRDVLPSLEIVMFGLEFHRAEPSASPSQLSAIVAYSFLLRVIWYLMLYAGYLMGAVAFQRVSRNVRIAVSRPLRGRSLGPRMYLIGAVSLAAFRMYVDAAGGLDRLLLQRGLPVDMRVQGEVGGHFEPLVRMWSIALLVAFAVDRSLAKRPLYWMMFASALFMGFAVSGSRSYVILMLVMLVSIRMLQDRRFAANRVLVVGVIGLMLIGLLGGVREASRYGDLKMALDTALRRSPIKSGMETVGSYAGEMNGFYGILLKVPESVKPLLGETYLAVLALPVPRKVFADKPEAGGKITAELIFRHPQTAIPPGSVGEAYLNFHLAGVVFVPIVFGMFLALLARLYRIYSGYPVAVVLYVLTLFLLQPDSESIYDWVFAIFPAVISGVFMGVWKYQVHQFHR